MNRATHQLLAFLTTSLLLLATIPPSTAQAVLIASSDELGMLEVSVQVDGLSCPFCAYGLEKKLRAVAHVASVGIHVDEQRAVMTLESGTSLDLEAVERAVRDGGFTPRGITLTARGRISEYNGAPALELPLDAVLLLAASAETSALLEAGVGAVAWVEGQAAFESPDGHPGHPYTLSVLAFEVG